MRLSSAGQYPCGPHAGIRDRDRRPCEGIPHASTARPAVSVRTASPECVKLHGGRGRAFGCCAIIKSDVGAFVNLIFKPSDAAKKLLFSSAPSPQLCCLIAIAILWLANPVAVRAATTLDDSARDLAQKIAADVAPGNAVSVEMRNVSPLEPGELSRVEHAIETELQARGIRSQPDAMTSVVITFSENVNGLVWTAEILQGDSTRVVLLSVPRESLDRSTPGGAKLVLEAEKFWEGPERILDAAQVSLPGGEEALVLLLPNEFSIHSSSRDTRTQLPLDMPTVNLRTPGGRIYYSNSQLAIQLGPNMCTVFLASGGLQECLSSSPTAEPVPIPNRGSQTAPIHTACGAAVQVLATGSGDYSQPDTIQAFDGQGNPPTPTSNELDFPGPILSLHEFVDNSIAVTAIVRNLKTQNYEAYHLSTSCSQ
jgi:hypothetical protein